MPLVQTLLASSPCNTLCVTRPPPEQQLDLISRLPNELLGLIFSSVEGERVHLARVSRQWQDISDVLLYRTLRLKDRNPRILAGAQSDRLKLSHLLTALKTRPYLCYYPRSLVIEIYGLTYSKDILEILELVTNVQEVTIYLDLGGEKISLLLQTLAKMKLEKLELWGFPGGPSVNLLFNVFGNMPTLKKFSTRGWGWSRDRKPFSGLKMLWAEQLVADDSDSMTADELHELLPPEKQHTAAFTVLNLQSPGTSVKVTECLFRWAAHLEEVKLTHLYGHYRLQYNAACIHNLLSIHRDSLRKISIRITPVRGDDIPNFTCFPYLEELHISCFKGYIRGGTPRTMYSKVATPSLRRLTLDFGHEDLTIRCWADFSDAQIQWTEEFLTTIGAGKGVFPPKMRPESIHIQFDLDAPWSRGVRSGTWHRLEQGARMARSYGVSLTYSVPGWTMEEYQYAQKEQLIRQMMMRYWTSLYG